MVYIVRFFSLQNAVCFIILTYLVPVLFTFYIQSVLTLKKIIPAPFTFKQVPHRGMYAAEKKSVSNVCKQEVTACFTSAAVTNYLPYPSVVVANTLTYCTETLFKP